MGVNPLWCRHTRHVIGAAFLVLAVLSGGLRSLAAPLKRTPAEGDELFSTTNITHIQIEIQTKALERLRGRGWSWGWAGANRERPEVQVTVLEEGRVYTNVALHLKGSAGSFQPVETKPAMTLNFDKYAHGQRFHGLQKLSLNNSVQDPTYLTEKICRELFVQAGIPAPRADFVAVQLNGRKLGLYVMLEGYNRQFLKRYFKNTKGNLYDGGFLKDVDSQLSTNSGENPQDQSDLRALVAASNEPDLTNRFQRLEQVLDMDRFLTFMAMEVLVCHWDGYCMNKNNYRVYHDMDTNRIIFMPHGMDQMFGVMMAQSSMPVRPPLQGLVARALMETPQGRRGYFQRIAQLNRSLFDVDTLTNHVFELANRIQPVLAEVSSSTAANHIREVADLCDRIVQRKQSLDDQLSGGRGKILEFNSAGIAPLSGWTAAPNGSSVLSEEKQSDGTSLLHIRATGSSLGSWRTKVVLEEGHYSFEARMQTRDVAVDSRDHRAGAGLRVYGKSSAQKIAGSADWTPVAFEFEVPDGLHDIELVCELRAAKGDVWFDTQSLKLVRK